MSGPSHAQLAQECTSRGLPEQGNTLTTPLGRRAFIGGALACFAAAAAQSRNAQTDTPLQIDTDFWKKPRELWLRRLSTGEASRVVYWRNGQYLPDPYVALCRLLRDVSADSAVQMDPTLLDVLAGIQGYYRAYGYRDPICVTSGYRTKALNDSLRSEGAARNSMHLYGKAADITLPGIPVWHLGRVEQYLHAGGVGFYPTRHFVHVDTGRLRSWTG